MPRLRLLQTVIFLACFPLALRGGPAAGQEGPVSSPCAGVVFVADGSGKLHGMFDGLSRVVAEAGLPLRVVAVGWSHGTGRVFADLHGRSNHRRQGQALAYEIAAYRQAHPGDRVCLVGHSAGAAVVLAAAAALPPGGVDRIILLAPALAPDYDLRPALVSSCEGIDCFHSHHDGVSALLAVVGTADGCWKGSAGRGGFRPVGHAPADALLYQGLRQHDWQRAGGAAGHHGGHFDWCRGDFLRASVLPLLAPGR